MIAAVAIALGLTGATGAGAQGAPLLKCRPGDTNCQQQQQPGSAAQPGQKTKPAATQDHSAKAKAPGTAAPRAQAETRVPKGKAAQPDSPRVGDSAKHAKHFQRAERSRLPEPPQGREYRVVNDNLVLVDKETMRIVAIVGVLSALFD
ncbi:hypothetical protein CKO19_15270 [Rhodovulum adriaticum]|nr:hypothetical protein [Rhodovulum adriaticum]